MKHVVHYPVLSAGQVLHTLGRGTALDQLLEVVSTARYSPPGATEGKGTEGHQVLQVPVRTVHRLRYGHALQRQPAERTVSGCMYVFWCLHTRAIIWCRVCRLYGADQAPQSLPKDSKT